MEYKDFIISTSFDSYLHIGSSTVDVFKDAMNKTLFRFNNAQTIGEANAFNQAFRKAESFHEFYRSVAYLADPLKKGELEKQYHQAVIVLLQMNTLIRLSGRIDVFPYWIYKSDFCTVPGHRKLHGSILSAKSMEWLHRFPPSDWGCTCQVYARMEHEVTLKAKK